MRKKVLVALLLTVMLVATAFSVQAQAKYVIGVSNSFVGSEWRTQMIQNIEETARLMGEAGPA